MFIETPTPYDLPATTRFLRTGGNDPTFRRLNDGFQTAFHTPVGPAELHIHQRAGGVEVVAFGEGADWASGGASELLGLHEAPWELPSHPRLDPLAKRHQGLRLTNTQRVFEALVITVLQQLVTWEEAVSGWRNLVEFVDTPAPGPGQLLLPPTPLQLRALPLARLQSFGIGRKRAETLKRVAHVARRMEEVNTMNTADAKRRLSAVRGIGPWTVASALGHRLGRPDVLITGDYHLPNTVAFVFEDQARGDEDDLQRLMRPFEGQEMRVLKVLSAANLSAPRRGPKRRLRFGR